MLRTTFYAFYEGYAKQHNSKQVSLVTTTAKHAIQVQVIGLGKWHISAFAIRYQRISFHIYLLAMSNATELAIFVTGSRTASSCISYRRDHTSHTCYVQNNDVIALYFSILLLSLKTAFLHFKKNCFFFSSNLFIQSIAFQMVSKKIYRKYTYTIYNTH